MQIAAFVFIISGAAFLALNLAFALNNGISFGNLFMALFASALLYQGYALFKSKKGARRAAILVAAVIATSCAYMVSILATPFLNNLSSIPASIWPMLCALLVVTAVFAVTAAILVFAKPFEEQH